MGFLRSSGRIDPDFGGQDIYDAFIGEVFQLTINIIINGKYKDAYGAIWVEVKRIK